MKLNIFLIAAAFGFFAACKSPYKATDRPVAKVDTTASATDSSSMNKMPATSDSTMTPSTVDSTKMPANPDTTTHVPVDSARQAEPDSSKMPTTDTMMSRTTPAAPAAITVVAATQTAFTTQYPTASNVVWANYDSLAAVPIDLRMAGWKKMDADDYLVVFDNENEKYYAWYDNEGNWIGSAYKMDDISKMPAAVSTAVKNAIKTKYTGYSITSVNREFQKDKKNYEVELQKDDSKVRMLVNSTGKITQVFKYVSKKTE